MFGDFTEFRDFRPFREFNDFSRSERIRNERDPVKEETAQRPQPTFEYAKLFATLEVIRAHQRIESLPKLAKALGIPIHALYQLRDNKSVTWDVMLKVTDWAQVDLRAFIGRAA